MPSSDCNPVPRQSPRGEAARAGGGSLGAELITLNTPYCCRAPRSERSDAGIRGEQLHGPAMTLTAPIDQEAHWPVPYYKLQRLCPPDALAYY